MISLSAITRWFRPSARSEGGAETHLEPGTSLPGLGAQSHEVHVEAAQSLESLMTPDSLMALYRPMAAHLSYDNTPDEPEIDFPTDDQLYHMTDPVERFELAIKLMALLPHTTSCKIQMFKILDPEQRLAVARVDAPHAAFRIKEFDLQGEEALVEIGRLALAKAFRNFLLIYGRFDLPADVIHTAILNPELRKIAHGSYDYQALHNFGDDLAYLVTNRSSLGEVYDRIGLRDGQWAGLTQRERLLQVTRWLQERYPEFDEELFAWSSETRTDTSAAAALALTIGHWHQVKVDGNANRARESLAHFTGYSSIPRGSISAKSRNGLWSVLLEAHKTFGPQLSTLIPVDFSRTSNALTVLTLALALKGLGGELPQFEEPISSQEQYAEVQDVLLRKLTLAFKKQVGLAEDEEGASQINHLISNWGGDISPLLVLAGRYAAHEEWHAQRPLLAEFARSCLDGSFHEWRYRRDDQQLDMLTPAQLTAWRNNPAIIAEYESRRIDPLSAKAVLFEAAEELFSSGFVAQLPRDIVSEMAKVSITAQELTRLLSQEENLFATTVSPAQAIGLIRYAIGSKDAEALRAAVKLINGAKLRIFKALDEEPRSALQASLSTLHNLVKEATASDVNRYCVVSVITDHPKLLLMTGNLMPHSTCVSYEREQAGALLGYVTDGNIKLALSYVIRTTLLERVSSKWAEGEFRFAPGSQSLIFERLEGRACVPLGSPVQRQILRLGSLSHANREVAGAKLGSTTYAHSSNAISDTNTAVCFREKVYKSGHPIDDKIWRQRSDLISKFLEKCAIREDLFGGPVNCPASRNPGGVYCDAAYDKGRIGDAMKGPYSIEFD